MPRTSEELVRGLRSGFEGWADGLPLVVYAPGVTPSPSHRPRVSRHGHAYYPKAYQNYHAACQEAFSRDLRGRPPMEGRLGVVVHVMCQRPKTTSLPAPKGDADNYAKAPLDAATKAGVWLDDSQIECLGMVKGWADPGMPGEVRLFIYRMKEDA